MSKNTGRPVWVNVSLLLLSGLMVICFLALGTWQVKRLGWKLELIENVEARAHGAPSSAPADFTVADHQYLRVELQGRFLDQDALLVKAVTELGPGYWVLSPLQTDGRVIWVNRGFVPNDRKDPAGWTPMTTPVIGLLRASKPEGTLLEKNKPEQGRWYSVDTSVMSSHLGLGPTANFFVDAEHAAEPTAWPRGGMTILKFKNNHLSYALTWFAMAILFVVAIVFIIRTGQHREDEDEL